MNKDFITYELAVKLKEKGFNEPCFGYYHTNKGDESFELCGNGDADFLNSMNFHRIAAPTISQVLKWLREEKKIYCLPHFEQGIDMWLFYIERPQAGCEYAECISESIYDTYEQAALAGIEHCLDNLI